MSPEDINPQERERLSVTAEEIEKDAEKYRSALRELLTEMLQKGRGGLDHAWGMDWTDEMISLDDKMRLQGIAEKLDLPETMQKMIWREVQDELQGRDKRRGAA